MFLDVPENNPAAITLAESLTQMWCLRLQGCIKKVCLILSTKKCLLLQPLSWGSARVYVCYGLATLH